MISDVGAMFHFSPLIYAYFHKSKMAAVGHLGFLFFDRIAPQSYVISHKFSTNLNILIAL